MKKSVIILGAGGHGRVVADIFRACGITVAGFLDDGKQKGDTIDGLPVLGAICDMPSFIGDYSFFTGIGSAVHRRRFKETYKGADWAIAVHPSAVIGNGVTVGAGTCIMPQAVVNNSAVIGEQCIVNSGAVIEHDCRLDDYVHVSPGAVLCGAVRVGENSQIGAGVTVKNGITVGKDITVGCGGCVVEDTLEPGTYIGVPARRKE